MKDGLGVWLRRARETRQLTLEDVERELKIRRRYLQALEMGDYAALPGEIQARGFLRNYVRFLGLPVDEALERYDSEIQGRPMQPRTQPRRVEAARQSISDRPSVFAPPPSEEDEAASASRDFPVQLVMTLLLGLMAVMMLIFIVSFLWLQFGARDMVPTPTLAALSQPTPALAAPVTVAVTAPPVFPPAADGTINVRLIPLEHAWISVSTHEQILFQDIATPEQTLEAASQGVVIVATGNGGAFRLYINGADWGALGAQGEVVRRAWSPQGELQMETP